MSVVTNNVESLKAEDILSIPDYEPERIFPADQEGIKALFRKLAGIWHPDRNADPRAASVFNHITGLRDSAYSKLEGGTWHVPGLLQIKQKSGKTAKISYLKKHDFELGEFYICKDKIVYVVRSDFSDLFENYLQVIRNFSYTNVKIRNQFERQLPKFVGQFEAADGSRVMVIERDEQMVLLRDLLDYQGGKMDPKHVAWIMSRLHNMTCYLQLEGLAHNAISADTVFVLPKDYTFRATEDQKISPKDHTMSLLGGWWYAAKANQNLLGLPPQTVNYAPRSVLANGQADIRTDHVLIRVTGREILGDITGVQLTSRGIPKPMADWLVLSGSGDAIKDFEAWGRVLKSSFGERRYVEMRVKSDDIYKQPQL